MNQIRKLIKILEEKEYIRVKEYSDTIFILAKYESVFDKIIEMCYERKIVIRTALNHTQQINPHPFDDIGQYNIAIYDIDKINNIFNEIRKGQIKRGGSWTLYQMAYYWRSGVFRTIRMSNMNTLTAHMEKHDISLLKEYIDEDKIRINHETHGAAGGFPVVIELTNVEQELINKKELEIKTKEVDEFVQNLQL